VLGGRSHASTFPQARLIRRLTDGPPEPAARVTAMLAPGEQLLLADLVLAECIYLLESFYEVPREQVAAWGDRAAADPRRARGVAAARYRDL
jgi:hypothetical protein